MKEIKKRGFLCKRIISVVLAFWLILYTIYTGAYGNGKAILAEAENTGVIRLGYAEVLEDSLFAQFLLKFAESLEEQGSIKKGFSRRYEGVNYEKNFHDGDTKTLWDAICANTVEGAKYQFVKEAFFNMDLMKESEYKTMVNRDDVDLILAMGTAPGVYLKEHETKNKFMVIMAADPIASGIVKSETERYTDNAYAMIDNTAYKRQIDAGFKFLGFHKLGIVYEDSEEGRLYASLDIVNEEAEKLGFEVLTEKIPPISEKDDEKEYYKNIKKAYRKLIDRGMDTLYITTSSTMDYEAMLHELLEDSILKNKIKTLAMDGNLPVMYGALFGVSLVDVEEQARHILSQIQSYAEEGTPFSELDQVCECTPRIYINLTTANTIGYELSFQDLQLVDTIYRDHQ